MVPVQNVAPQSPGRCTYDHKIFAKALQDAGQPQGTCYYCGEELVLGVKKEKVDDAEERLRAKLIPKFNHEDRCNTLVLSAGLQNAPKLPWFGDGTDDRTMQSKRQLKRWTATNLVSWPVCRHARVPLELEYHEEPLRDDPYGGSYCRMRFYCKECGR